MKRKKRKKGTFRVRNLIRERERVQQYTPVLKHWNGLSQGVERFGASITTTHGVKEEKKNIRGGSVWRNITLLSLELRKERRGVEGHVLKGGIDTRGCVFEMVEWEGGKNFSRNWWRSLQGKGEGIRQKMEREGGLYFSQEETRVE